MVNYYYKNGYSKQELNPIDEKSRNLQNSKFKADKNKIFHVKNDLNNIELNNIDISSDIYRNQLNY